MTKTTMTFGALVVLMFAVTFIILAFYDWLSTPQPRILPLLYWFLFPIFIFIVAYGEYLGFVMKNKNFLTEGGLIGVYRWHVNHDSGLSTYYFTTYTRYLKALGIKDFQEKNFVQRLFTMISPTRIAKKTAPTYLFEHKDGDMADVGEGVVFFRGMMREGVEVLEITEVWKLKFMQLNKVVSELMTITEKAKSVSEQAAQSQNKDMVDMGIKLGTVIDNIGKTFREVNQGEGRIE